MLFFLLDYLISLATYDSIFEVKLAQKIENIFWIKILLDRKSLTLKEKRNILDFSIFYKKLRDIEESNILSTNSLSTSTKIENLKRLREKTSF